MFIKELTYQFSDTIEQEKPNIKCYRIFLHGFTSLDNSHNCEENVLQADRDVKHAKQRVDKIS